MGGGNAGRGSKQVRTISLLQHSRLPKTLTQLNLPPVFQGGSSISISFSVGYLGVHILDNEFKAEALEVQFQPKSPMKRNQSIQREAYIL